METLTQVSSLLSPILLILIGYVINRKIESQKNRLSKERQWQEHWAARFLDVVEAYNENITSIVTGMYQLNQTTLEKKPDWEDKMQSIIAKLGTLIQSLQVLEWKINEVSRFSSSHGASVVKSHKALFQLVSSLIAEKKGDLEEIRDAQFTFNEAVRLAHAEILELSPNEHLEHKHD